MESNWKCKWKKMEFPSQDLNPDLPFQRQTTCPSHHHSLVVRGAKKWIHIQTINFSISMEGQTSVSFWFFSKEISVWAFPPFFWFSLIWVHQLPPNWRKLKIFHANFWHSEKWKQIFRKYPALKCTVRLFQNGIYSCLSIRS